MITRNDLKPGVMLTWNRHEGGDTLFIVIKRCDVRAGKVYIYDEKVFHQYASGKFANGADHFSSPYVFPEAELENYISITDNETIHKVCTECGPVVYNFTK